MFFNVISLNVNAFLISLIQHLGQRKISSFAVEMGPGSGLQVIFIGKIKKTYHGH